jgi:hypothetical protein
MVEKVKNSLLQEAINRKIDKAIQESECGENMITFSSEEFKTLIQKLDAK